MFHPDGIKWIEHAAPATRQHIMILGMAADSTLFSAQTRCELSDKTLRQSGKHLDLVLHDQKATVVSNHMSARHPWTEFSESRAPHNYSHNHSQDTQTKPPVQFRAEPE